MTTQFNMEVKDKKITKQEGFFYKAAPFQIDDTTNNTTYKCEFKHGKKGKVVFEISENGTLLNSVEHPDYLPESEEGVPLSPENLSDKQTVICAAFIALEISPNKAYKSFYENNLPDFNVSQPQFMS